MGPARIAENIVNGNRTDAARAVAIAPNPANMALTVVSYLHDDHGYQWHTAVETMTSLTNRTEFWEEP